MKDCIRSLVAAILGGKYYGLSMRMCGVNMLLNAAKEKGFITNDDVIEILTEQSMATRDD